MGNKCTWRVTTLDQIGRIVTGRTPPSTVMDAFGGHLPFVTPSDMNGVRIISETVRSLSDSGCAAVRNAVIPKNAVMVSCIGSDMGKAAMNGTMCVTNQQINSIIVDAEHSSLFIYYNLSQRKTEIRASASGSAQPILNKSALVKGPGVVTGRSGVLGKVFFEIEDFWPLNTTLWVKEFRAASPCYAYELLRTLDFQRFNAGSAVPTLNRNHVHELPVVIPPYERVAEYEKIIMPLQKKVKQTIAQSRTLAALRDTLLPKLISGTLRIPDAERIMP